MEKRFVTIEEGIYKIYGLPTLYYYIKQSYLWRFRNDEKRWCYVGRCQTIDQPDNMHFVIQYGSASGSWQIAVGKEPINAFTFLVLTGTPLHVGELV